MYALNKQYALNNGMRLTTRVYGRSILLIGTLYTTVEVNMSNQLNAEMRKSLNTNPLH